jgi:hypothetical protein
MEAAGGELRLMTLHRRVEGLLEDPVPSARFKDYVNEQSRGKRAILERWAMVGIACANNNCLNGCLARQQG